MNFFPNPPEDLDVSMPVEPMRLAVVGEQQDALIALLKLLVETHPTKLKKEEKHKLRDTFRLILLNVIYNSIRQAYTALPRGKEAFDPGTYWKRLGLSYRFTVAALDRLTEEGYIRQFKGFYNGPASFGRLTRIYGLEKLSEAVNAELVGQHLMVDGEDETLELKGFDYGVGALPLDHDDIVRLRLINDFLKPFSWQQKGPMRLIYSGGPMRGGRVYTRFQNMPKDTRKDLLINGNPTVEIDYKANHIMMLIALSGQELPADPYIVIANKAKTTREKVKAFINKCLSAADAEAGFNACKKAKINKELFIRMETATAEEFPGVRLYGGAGVALQSLEGQIALNIMVDGAKEGIPVLPIHDSFITTEEHDEWLKQKMLSHWQEYLGVRYLTKVEKKT